MMGKQERKKRIRDRYGPLRAHTPGIGREKKSTTGVRLTVKERRFEKERGDNPVTGGEDKTR